MTTCGWGVWWVVAWCWDAGIYDYLQGEGVETIANKWIPCGNGKVLESREWEGVLLFVG